MRIVSIAMLSVALMGCGSEPEPDPAPLPVARTTPAWITIEGVEFPTAMASAPGPVLEAYIFAAHHPEVLRHMPCYCGCEDPRFEHRSNYDCFVDAIDRTGPRPRVYIDTMGFS